MEEYEVNINLEFLSARVRWKWGRICKSSRACQRVQRTY